MKILYVITGLGLGGAEKVVVDLADQMLLRGHDVKIAYLTGEVCVRPSAHNIELIYLGLESSFNFFSSSKKYRQFIKSYQPDIVHAHMFHANIFTRLNRINCSIPKLICSAHSSNEGGKLRMMAYKYTNFLSNINTNVSQSAADAFIQTGTFNDKNIFPIYNGVDLNKFFCCDLERKKSNVMNLLAVGRFSSAKDYPNLLYALSKVILDYQNVHLKIVGDGELRTEIEQLITDLKLEKYVTLLGRRNDIPHLMQQADYLILSSKYEGLPTVIIESMSCGLNVIATDCGGTKEIMGNTGILVEKENSVKLAEGIKTALGWNEDKQKINRDMARNRVVQLFSLERSVMKWLDFYESK